LKPDPRAYWLGCEALGLIPDQILFIDDQSRNIDGAGRVGLDALWFDVMQPALSFAEAERRLLNRRWPIVVSEALLFLGSRSILNRSAPLP
jgi:FMN phosphatase YigB (HAD superfamily)